MPKHKKNPSNNNASTTSNTTATTSAAPILEDRFAAAETRPHFRASASSSKRHPSASASSSKVVLDERFASVLTDSRFQLQTKDKYGRTNKQKSKNSNNNNNNNKKDSDIQHELSAFYTIEGGHEPDKDKKDPENSDDQQKGLPQPQQLPDQDEEEDTRPEDPASRIAYLTKLSRGELDMSSSSEEEEDDSSHSSNDDDNDDDDDNNEEEGDDGRPVHGSAGILDPSTTAADEDISISYEASPYLVATNLDWENLRAVDIFTILSSFVPPGGAVKRVQVYQSDFGKERMEKDRLAGPTAIWKRKKKLLQITRTRDEDDEEEENSTASESDDDDDVDNNDDDDESDGDAQPEEDDDTGNEDEDDDDNNDKEGGDEENDNDEDEEDEEGVSMDNEEEKEVAYDESDFDAEKLRAYEASKLKYYFAIIEFSKPEDADVAYREVDGMEFEHSSSAIDLRTLPPEALEDVIKNRAMRDEATSIPSNYQPPDFVVSALQQTNVQCTWDQGDTERERKLTNYFNGAWQGMSEADDIKAYLASDASSDDESEDEKAAKGSNIRKLLGLDSGDEDDDDGSGSEQQHSSDEGSDDDSEKEQGKTIKFIPGAKKLEERIRSKLESKEEEELTPWQKYQEKRKQKRKERKQALKNGIKPAEGSKQVQQRGAPRDDVSEDEEQDDFFMEEDDDSKPSKKEKKDKKRSEKVASSSRSSKQELELLLAGENEEEEARDYDIRGIQRIEKNKNKKLQGSRKRKEEKLSEDVSGKDFKLDVQDSRFAAVLEGSDDRFGIDKTDPNFKDTPAMQKILSEQTERRKKKRKKSNGKSSNGPVAPNIDVGKNAMSAGASALSALVQKLKTQVS